MSVPEARCRNCGAPLVGPYCANCGQQDLPPDPTLRELLAEAWDAFVSIDGKVLATLRMLLGRPGRLTQEYLAGHRARYVPPLRLYLVCSVMYFLIASLGGGSEIRTADAPGLRAADTSVARQTDSTAEQALAKRRRVDDELAKRLQGWPNWLSIRLRRGVGDAMRDGKGFESLMAENIPRMLFVLVPVFALLLALFYRSRRLRAPVHLIVALHLHAFVFAALVMSTAAGWLPGAISGKLHFAITLWIIAYVPLALRRVYGGRLRGAVMRALALCTIYSIIGAIGTGVLATVLLLSY